MNALFASFGHSTNICRRWSPCGIDGLGGIKNEGRHNLTSFKDHRFSRIKAQMGGNEFHLFQHPRGTAVRMGPNETQAELKLIHSAYSLKMAVCPRGGAWLNATLRPKHLANPQLNCAILQR